jgi:hypothetical protein
MGGLWRLIDKSRALGERAMRHTRYPAFTYVPLTNTKPIACPRCKRYVHLIQRVPLPAGLKAPLLQINRLITPVGVQLCTPHLVHTLMLGSAEGHECPEPNVIVAKIFESLHEFFGVEIRTIAF